MSVQRIAILGGGMSSLTTAFELTNDADWSNRYEITVYQLGWRLGGKGASGRNPAAHQRIEEHGLHVWPGFYDNAFRVIRRCYAEINRPAEVPISSWEQAFIPQDTVAVEEKVGNEYKHWVYEAVRLPGQPGDIRTTPPISQFVSNLLTVARGAIESFDAEIEQTSDEFFTPFSLFPEELRALLGAAVANTFSELIEKIKVVALAVPGNSMLQEGLSKLLAQVLELCQSWLMARMELLPELNDRLRRLWIFVDMTKTNLRGILADGALLRGFDILDNEDYRRWLRRHGASTTTINSALVSGLYDFVFANIDGKPDLAAGAALRLSLRTAFGYQGAIMYEMQAGMGDIVFAPLYEILKKRGVKFEFFHKVESLIPSADDSSIDEILIKRQVTLKNREYEPLIDVKKLPAWPNQPRFEQLVEGEQVMTDNVNLESTWSGWQGVEDIRLKVGEDFDVVVFGIPLGAVPTVCSRLVAARPRWQAMTRIPTVATVAVQLWWDVDLSGLGWSEASPVLTAHVDPFETWADLSQTITAEAWPNSGGIPKNVAYLCGVVPDPDDLPAPNTVSNFPELQKQEVKKKLASWLVNHAHPLWPNVVSKAGDVKWELLNSPQGEHGPERLDSQFFRANFEPSDRYIQSPAGTLEFRLRPFESGYFNLFLAGDWTRNGINVGCIEAAVISGIRAARSINGDSRPIPGETDF